MNTATTSDLAYRLLELEQLRALTLRLMDAPELDANERHGLFMAGMDLLLRISDLNTGRAQCGNLSPERAAYEERREFIDSMEHLRRDEALSEGEKSGISEVLVAVRLGFDGSIAQAREAADIKENARRIAAREKAKESPGLHGCGTDAGYQGWWPASFARWAGLVLMLVGLALAGILADWMAQR